MKFLKKRLQKTRALISIKTYKRPRIFVIMTMVAINISILVVAALIAMVIDDNYTNFIHAFTKGSVTWLLTPNSILAIDNPQTFLLAVIVFIVGLVLFSGTIIALTTNAIKDYFAKKESGSGRIHLQDHIVVLNWNNKVPELVADLLFVQSKDINLMILSEEDKVYVEKQILNAVKKTKKTGETLNRFNVLAKKGDPLSKTDLEDISITEADAVLIMNKDSHKIVGTELTESDLNIIKIILGLGRFELTRKPTIVAEIKAIATKAKILTMASVVHTLKSYPIIPVCFDRRLGQIIAQTIIERHIEDVYLSLFSFDGSEVYRLENTDFDTCMSHHSQAIPFEQDGADLYVLSDNNLTKKTTSHYDNAPPKLKAKPLSQKTNQDVYIVGKNNKLSFILEAFEAYERLHQSTFHAEWIEREKVTELIEKLNQDRDPFTILLLSEEAVESEALDANVIDTLIYIEGHLKRHDGHIIVELLDPKNDMLIKDFNIENTIISNKIISLLLSKLALFPETASFYEDLLTIEPSAAGKDDYAIVVQTAKDCFDTAFPLHFKTQKHLIHASYNAYNKRAIMFGIIRNEKVLIFEGDLHQALPFELQSDDFCIFMKL